MSGAKQIERWLETDRLQLTRIPELLAGRGCEVSYTTLRRFIRRRGWTRIAFVRAGLGRARHRFGRGRRTGVGWPFRWWP